MTEALLPLKRCIDPSRPLTYGIVQAGDDVEGGVPYIRPVDMTEHDGVCDPTKLLRTAPEIATAYRRSTVLPGDIVLSIGPSYGKTLIVPDELDGANLTQGTARIAPAMGIDVRYLRWALRSTLALQFWDSAVGGATFRALNLEPLGRTPIPVWDLSRQRAIADFLDTETARIDQLVRTRLRSVELLQERFVASAARLTSGSGNALTRETPYPWMPTIHAERRLPSLSHVFKIGSGTTPASDEPTFYDGGIPWVITGDLRDGPIYGTSRTISAMALSLYPSLHRYPAGSLVIAMYGATIGRLGLLQHEATVNQACCVISAIGNDPAATRWLFYWFLGHRRGLLSLVLGGGQPNISQETVRSLRVPLPPRSDRDACVSQLDQETESLSTLTEHIVQHEALLRERRQALITAAVTGEIEIPAAA